MTKPPGDEAARAEALRLKTLLEPDLLVLWRRMPPAWSRPKEIRQAWYGRRRVPLATQYERLSRLVRLGAVEARLQPGSRAIWTYRPRPRVRVAIDVRRHP